MTKTLKIVAGDVVIKRSSGQLESTDRQPKARQQVSRLLGLNAPQGAGLNEIIGTVPSSEFALSARLQRQTRAAFESLVRAQTDNQLSDRTREERFAAIARMFVVPVEGSKTAFAFRLDVILVAGATVSTSALLNPPRGG